MNPPSFSNRAEAGRLLGESLARLDLDHPLILAIPRGGVEVGASIAEVLHAELDVILARKLRAAEQPELALGAIAEDGEVYLDDPDNLFNPAVRAHLARERAFQLDELRRRAVLLRGVRPPVPIAGRHVIITDDGIATGSTMIAALRAVRARRPASLTVAAPVAAGEHLPAIRALCDIVVCLAVPEHFYAIGQYYADFDQLDDDRVMQLLRRHLPAPAG